MPRKASPLAAVEPVSVAIRPLAYRPKDAAMMLGVSRSTIYQLIADGALQARKIGTATVIPYSELVRVLDEAPLTDASKAAQR